MKEIINKLSKNIAYYSFGLSIILYSFCNIFFTAKQYGISRINVCFLALIIYVVINDFDINSYFLSIAMLILSSTSIFIYEIFFIK